MCEARPPRVPERFFPAQDFRRETADSISGARTLGVARREQRTSSFRGGGRRSTVHGSNETWCLSGSLERTPNLGPTLKSLSWLLGQLKLTPYRRPGIQTKFHEKKSQNNPDRAPDNMPYCLRFLRSNPNRPIPDPIKTTMTTKNMDEFGFAFGGPDTSLLILSSSNLSSSVTASPLPV